MERIKNIYLARRRGFAGIIMILIGIVLTPLLYGGIVVAIIGLAKDKRKNIAIVGLILGCAGLFVHHGMCSIFKERCEIEMKKLQDCEKQLDEYYKGTRTQIDLDCPVQPFQP